MRWLDLSTPALAFLAVSLWVTGAAYAVWLYFEAHRDEHV